VRFAAVLCRRVQHFGFEHSANTATEIEFHLKVRRRVLVQNDHRCPAAGQFRGVGSCIDSRILQLRRELGFQQLCFAKILYVVKMARFPAHSIHQLVSCCKSSRRVKRYTPGTQHDARADLLSFQ